jgi:2-oxoglutarate ferredoxin oxidoreductase subunit beta
MAVVYQKSSCLTDVPLSYCPGCCHGIITSCREVIEELGVEPITVGVAPVGCSLWPKTLFTLRYGRGAPRQSAAPSQRAFAAPCRTTSSSPIRETATLPLSHRRDRAPATRGENITVIFVNNAIYGMTGAKCSDHAPGQVTQTTPYGRDPQTAGWPIRICEMLATLTEPPMPSALPSTPCRISGTRRPRSKRPSRIRSTTRAISIVEVLSTCPTNWGHDAGRP